MPNLLLSLLILWPLAAGFGCLLLPWSRVRLVLTAATALILPGAALALILSVGPSGQLVLDLPRAGSTIRHLATVADFLLLAGFLVVALRRRSLLTALFVLPQVGLLAWLETLAPAGNQALFFADRLSLALVGVVSVVGSLICLYALPYMRRHEEHQNLERSRQPGFFLVLVGFLGIMNGLALTSDLALFYLFFELTTLCSFLLIGHDDTERARANALTALWMNSVGGLALVAAAVWLARSGHGLDIQSLVHAPGIQLIPLALICLAGMAKAAQAPFMGWLLGAMVAPTPTSALLHSSTMVKAGVYLVLRFSPAFSGTILGPAVALAGGFGFLAGAVLAMGRSDGKEVLAYSTISNLGLILACAGLGTDWALAAGTLLLVYHALAKGLLFLCVGSAEQGLGGRQAENLRGMVAGLPRTAVLLALGVAAMLLPPFGMLLGKWMAVEAAASNPILLILLALGSGLTVAYWARWAGLVLGRGNGEEHGGEMAPVDRGFLRLGPEAVLAGLTVVGGAAAPWLYGLVAGSMSGPGHDLGRFQVGGFVIAPLVAALLVGLAAGLRGLGAAHRARPVGAYLGGLADTGQGSGPMGYAGPVGYAGPLGQAVETRAGLYAFARLFGAKRLLPWINGAALLGLAVILALAWLGGGR